MDGLVTCHDYFSTGPSGEAILYKLCKDRSTVADNARCFATQDCSKYIDFYCKIFVGSKDLLEKVLDMSENLRFMCYLNMCQYRYKQVECSNADYMSPSTGLSPFLLVPTDDGDLLLSTFRAVTGYIEAQDKGLPCAQEITEKAQINATTSLLNHFVIAEQYYTWVHYETYRNKTLLAAGSDKAWPLNVIVPTIDRMSFIWNNFSLFRTSESQVLDRYGQALWSLSQLLGEHNSFSSSGKCSLDALVYGHVESIRNSNINQLSTPLHNYPNLLHFTEAIKHEHFNIGMVIEE